MAIKISGNTVIDDNKNLVNLESMSFSGTGALKIPTGNSAQRPSSANGMIRFNTDDESIEFFSEGEWGAGGIAESIREPSAIYVDEENYFEITNFDSNLTYNISVLNSNGTAVLNENYVVYTPTSSGSGGVSINDRNISVTVLSSGSHFGQQAYTTPGTYSWTCPSNVYKVSVVAVGGGGGGTHDYDQFTNLRGGAGGGLGWKNDIRVVPGQSYTVVVGAGGGDSTDGANSYFIDTSTVAGFGGAGGVRSYQVGQNAVGGGYVGDGGGNGGDGGSWQTDGPNYPNGGGGAAGYTGDGGRGSGYTNDYTDDNAFPGSGGGGAGGAANRNNSIGEGGGGVGILGEGDSGISGATTRGGSGSTTTITIAGGSYGGGGGTNPDSSSSSSGGTGGSGAVRIIWATRDVPNTLFKRHFPKTNTEDL